MWSTFRRFASAGSALTKRKRFYKEVGVVREADSLDGSTQFKVTLDGRILKTQRGAPFRMRSEPLALAVAEEWASQGEQLEIGHMRLTGLAMTATDNPLHLTKESITSKILSFLETDTVLFYAPDNELLMEAQRKYWDPLIGDTNSDLHTKLRPVADLFAEPVSEEDKKKFESWLMSHNFWALTGMQYAVESSKSVLIPLGLIRHRLTVIEAVRLSLLEQAVQTEQWGQVEWAHGIEHEELSSRLAASTLFVYFNSNRHMTKASASVAQ